jgi:hypothetical protein
VLLPIFGVETHDGPPQHVSMPLLEQGVAKGRQQGSGQPLTKPLCHHLRMAGSRLDIDQCPVVFHPI